VPQTILPPQFRRSRSCEVEGECAVHPFRIASLALTDLPIESQNHSITTSISFGLSNSDVTRCVGTSSERPCIWL
jgi:hypothetical protein